MNISEQLADSCLTWQTINHLALTAMSWPWLCPHSQNLWAQLLVYRPARELTGMWEKLVFIRLQWFYGLFRRCQMNSLSKKREKWQNSICLFLFLLNSCRQCSAFFRSGIILQLLVKPNVYSDNEDTVQKDICEKNHFESQNGRSRKTNIAIMLISFSIVHPVRTKLSQTFSNKGRLIFSVPSHEGWTKWLWGFCC